MLNLTRNTKSLIQILFGIILLFICSQLSIGIQPIPITMQTVAVMLIGLLATPRMAISIVLIYLILGAVGVPVFANFQSGQKALFGPTGGYLWGFLLAVFIMSSLNKHINKRKILHIVLNCLIGTVIILLVGVIWLKFFIGFGAAINSGFYPFIIPGLIKVFLTSIIFYMFGLFCLHKCKV